MSTVTIAIPTIPGREALLERAARSAQCQLRPADAILVERDEHRSGAAAARNRLLELVDTEWIAWLDDDDELLSNHLRALLDAAEASGADLVYPRPVLLPLGTTDPTATRTPSGFWATPPWGIQFGPLQVKQLRHESNFIPVTYLVRTEMARKAGGFPEPYSEDWPRDCEDWGHLVRLLDAGARFHHHDEPTWLWHHHDHHTAGHGASEEDR